MCCLYQDPWGPIQGPLHPVGGGEDKAAALSILEVFQLTIQVWGKPLSDVWWGDTSYKEGYGPILETRGQEHLCPGLSNAVQAQP